MHPKSHKKLSKKGKKKTPKPRNTLVFDCSSLAEIGGGVVPLDALRKLCRAGWKIIICGIYEWREEELETFAKKNFSVFFGSPTVEELRILATARKKYFFISHNLAEREKVETAGWQFVSDEDFKTTKKYFQKGDYHWRDYERPSLYRKHVEVVESFFRDKSGFLLDVGCGDGLILSRLNQNENLNCFGIDVAPLAIEFARQHEIYNCGVAGINEFSGKYNYIFVGDLFEHLKYPDLALQRMHGWFLGDGLLFSSFPIQAEKMGDDFHIFTRESIEELFRDLFTIESFETRNDLKKMYIVAKKKIQIAPETSQRTIENLHNIQKRGEKNTQLRNPKE